MLIRKDIKKKLLFAILACSLLLLPCACGEDSNISLVKKGNFFGYDTTTIGKMLDSTFEKTKWSSQLKPNGETLVLFEGVISLKMHKSLKQKYYPMYPMQKITSNDADVDDVVYKIINFSINPSPFKTYKATISPVAWECYNKFVTDDPSGSHRPNIENSLAASRRLLVNSRARGDVKDEKYALDSIADYEKQLAYLDWKGSPSWKAARVECANKLFELRNAMLDNDFWAEGDPIFIEWKMHSNGTSFEFSKFGGETIPNYTTLGDFLKIIYEQ